MLSAAPALAMDGACVWDHLQPATRDAFVSGYVRQGPEVIDRVSVSEQEYDAIDQACAPRPLDEDIKDRLLAAVVLEQGSAAVLKGRLGWTDADLQAGWRRLGPDQRAALGQGARAALDGTGAPPGDASDELLGAVRTFLGRSAGDDRVTEDQAGGYLTSRAVREAIEAKG